MKCVVGAEVLYTPWGMLLFQGLFPFCVGACFESGIRKCRLLTPVLIQNIGVFSVHAVSPQAQFLNLLLCRCFQLSYLEKHPEEAQEDSAGSAPRRNPSLLNHGFPLSVSALVSFRRAPFRGLLPGLKVWTLTSRIHLCDSCFALARTRFCANNGCCDQSY